MLKVQETTNSIFPKFEEKIHIWWEKHRLKRQCNIVQWAAILEAKQLSL